MFSTIFWKHRLWLESFRFLRLVSFPQLDTRRGITLGSYPSTSFLLHSLTPSLLSIPFYYFVPFSLISTIAKFWLLFCVSRGSWEGHRTLSTLVSDRKDRFDILVSSVRTLLLEMRTSYSFFLINLFILSSLNSDS